VNQGTPSPRVSRAELAWVRLRERGLGVDRAELLALRGVVFEREVERNRPEPERLEARRER